MAGEQLWIKILVVLIAVFFVFFTAFNVYYFNRLRNCTDATKCLTTTEITSMFWLNVVLLVVSLVLLLIGLYRLFVHKETRDKIGATIAGIPTTEATGFKFTKTTKSS